MSAPRHSPAPFRHDQSPTGHLIRDSFGDSIAGLAHSTGDHSAMEQLANALLFTAAPDLLAAAKLGRAAIAEDRQLTIESAALLEVGSLEPDLDSLDDDAREVVAELDAKLAQIDAAIAKAEGQS